LKAEQSFSSIYRRINEILSVIVSSKAIVKQEVEILFDEANEILNQFVQNYSANTLDLEEINGKILEFIDKLQSSEECERIIFKV